MENSYSPESSGASSTKNQGSWYAILAVAIGAFALVKRAMLNGILLQHLLEG